MTSCIYRGDDTLPNAYWNIVGVCKSAASCKGAYKSENDACGTTLMCCAELHRIPCGNRTHTQTGLCLAANASLCSGTRVPSLCGYFPQGVTCCTIPNLDALPNNATSTSSTNAATTTRSSTSIGPSTSSVSVLTLSTTSTALDVTGSPSTTMRTLQFNDPTSVGPVMAPGVDVNAIIGACIGAVVGVAFILCLVLAVLFMRKRRQERHLQAVANDYISGRPIAHPSSGSARSVVTPSTSPNSPQQTYANLHLTIDPDASGRSNASTEFGHLNNSGTMMTDALSERNVSQRSAATARTHAEPESAPSVPYSQLDPNGERFAKFHSIDH